MTRCQRPELFTPAEEKRVRGDKKRVSPSLDHGHKRRLDLLLTGCVDDAELQSERSSCSLSGC
jgi:hypothetical protein